MSDKTTSFQIYAGASLGPKPEHETISALRVPTHECDERPALIVSRERPSGAIRHAWIPQTVYDQIWVLYEFPTEAERLAWEGGLSPLMKGWLNRSLIEYALPYGWENRDAFGFAITASRIL